VTPRLACILASRAPAFQAVAIHRNPLSRVLAAGVETQEDLAFLQARQCGEAQGYYFSRPVLPEQFAKLLETGIRELTLR